MLLKYLKKILPITFDCYNIEYQYTSCTYLLDNCTPCRLCHDLFTCPFVLFSDIVCLPCNIIKCIKPSNKIANSNENDLENENNNENENDLDDEDM